MSQTAAISDPYSIAKFRLSTIRRAARIKADHGISMARNLPRVQDIAAQYVLTPTPRTWKQCADQLDALCDEVEARTCPYGEADGVGHFAPMAAVEAGLVQVAA